MTSSWNSRNAHYPGVEPLVPRASNRFQVEVLSRNCSAPFPQADVNSQFVEVMQSADVRPAAKPFKQDAYSIRDEQIIRVANTGVAKDRKTTGQKFADFCWR